MKYDVAKYKIWTWKHPLNLHFILNPALAINELIFGQRIPKVLLIEKNSKKSLAEKSFVPCPHCNTIHSGLKWTKQNKTEFGNWFGLYCDHCGKIIPCLINLTSAVVLGITFPVWIWFVKSWKKKWILKQKKKFSKPLQLTAEYNWLREGLSFGFFLFVLMELIFPLFEVEDYKPTKIVIGFVVYILCGLLYSFVIKKLLFNPSRKISESQIQKAT